MLMVFFLFFRLSFFKKEKKRACCIFMFFFTHLLFKIKLSITEHDFDAQSKTDIFKMFFMIIPLKYFSNILVLRLTFKYCSDFSSWL